eukprot:tig00000448_g910.t1
MTPQRPADSVAGTPRSPKSSQVLLSPNSSAPRQAWPSPASPRTTAGTHPSYPQSPLKAPPSVASAFSPGAAGASLSGLSPSRDAALKEIDSVSLEVARLFGSSAQRPYTSEPLPFLYTTNPPSSAPLFPQLGHAGGPGPLPASQTAAALQGEILRLKQRLGGAVAAIRDSLAHESAERKRAQQNAEDAVLKLADVQRERDELRARVRELESKGQIGALEALAEQVEGARRSDLLAADRAVRAEAELQALRGRCEAQAAAIARLEGAAREERGLREAVERQLAAERRAAEAAAERSLRASEGAGAGGAELRELEAEWRGRLAAERRVLERAHESEIALYREAAVPDVALERALEEALRQAREQEECVSRLTDKVARLESSVPLPAPAAAAARPQARAVAAAAASAEEAAGGAPRGAPPRAGSRGSSRGGSRGPSRAASGGLRTPDVEREVEEAIEEAARAAS